MFFYLFFALKIIFVKKNLKTFVNYFLCKFYLIKTVPL